MTKFLSATAGIALLALAPAAWAQSSTTQSTPSYGTTDHAGGGGQASSSSWFGLQVVSPVDPSYSRTEPEHNGEADLTDLNGNDHGRGTAYNPIVGHDSGM